MRCEVGGECNGGEEGDVGANGEVNANDDTDGNDEMNLTNEIEEEFVEIDNRSDDAINPVSVQYAEDGCERQ